MIRLKIPDLVALKGLDHGYTKVSLDFSTNEVEKGVIAPYSLVAPTGTVSTPLLWEEVNEELKPEAFNHETIFKRLKQEGDPFEALLRKKVNADALLERLEENYSFLF
jgi:bifunctional non-homologous end joining protein LigD